MKKVLFAVVILFAACKDVNKQEMQTLDFGPFSINAPIGWTKIKQNGVDSYIGRIAIGRNDTLDFNLGWYSDPMTERLPSFFDSSQYGKIDTSFVDTTGAIYVKNEMLIDYDRYRKNNIGWDTIDGRTAKIIFPVRSGIGTTGIYIDTLWVTGTFVDRFSMSGDNLTPENEKLVLALFKTIKFKKPR